MKVSVLDYLKRLVKWDSKLEIYTNGIDNAYPERMERLKNNSVTSKTASNIMVQYLLGKGFGEADKVMVGKNLKLIDFAEDVAEDIVDQKGFFVHVNYNLNYEISSLKVLPFNSCRLGKKDSDKYNGKILIKEDWSDAKEVAKVIDVYNPKKDVLEAQINEAGSIDKYKGQVLYYNIDNKYYYPLSRIDAVQNDCDSEAQASVYKNQLLRKGFFGKTLVVMPPLVDDTIQEHIYIDGKQTINPEYQHLRSEADKTKATIEEFIGAENAGGAMLMEMEFAGDDIEKTILFKNIESNLEPDLFKNVEESVRENILIAYNNLPIDLVKVSSGLSNSGEAVLQNKLMYQENTTKERNILEKVVNDLMKRFDGYNGEYLTIKKLVDDTTDRQDGSTEV